MGSQSLATSVAQQWDRRARAINKQDQDKEPGLLGAQVKLPSTTDAAKLS